MITTIDKAGRLVIPKQMREKLQMTGGCSVTITEDADGLRIQIPRSDANFVEKEGVLVLASETVSGIDAAAFINQMRENRAVTGD